VQFCRFESRKPSTIHSRSSGTIDTPTTCVHNRAHSLLGTVTLINSGGVKLVSWITCLSKRQIAAVPYIHCYFGVVVGGLFKTISSDPIYFLPFTMYAQSTHTSVDSSTRHVIIYNIFVVSFTSCNF
jgi:hypothetical protein